MSYNIGDFSGVGFGNGSEYGKMILRNAISRQKAQIIGLQEDVGLYGIENPRDAIYPMYDYYYRVGGRKYNYKAFASDFVITGVKQVFYKYKDLNFSHDFFFSWRN